jgi:two-component system response regulator FixJ
MSRTQENATIHIVDDDRGIRDSLGLLLMTEGYRVCTHASAQSFLSSVKHGEDGCVLIDVRMPKVSGLDLLAEIEARGVFMPIIVITGYASISLAIRAMKMGAFDFLEKPLDSDALIECVREALDRKKKKGAGEAELRAIRSRLATLTKREDEVVTWMLKGKHNKDIAQELGISTRTAEVHRANIMLKLQANSLVELVRMLMSVGR